MKVLKSIPWAKLLKMKMIYMKIILILKIKINKNYDIDDRI